MLCREPFDEEPIWSIHRKVSKLLGAFATSWFARFCCACLVSNSFLRVNPLRE